MNADGVAYEITFSPSITSVDTAAREFCVRNAGAFGITTEVQLPGCVNPVSDHLRREVAVRSSVTVSYTNHN